METTTKFVVDDVVVYQNPDRADDPFNGVHVVITSVNPAVPLFGDAEHYGIFVPALEGYSYALASELKEKKL